MKGTKTRAVEAYDLIVEAAKTKYSDKIGLLQEFIKEKGWYRKEPVWRDMTFEAFDSAFSEYLNPATATSSTNTLGTELAELVADLQVIQNIHKSDKDIKKEFDSLFRKVRNIQAKLALDGFALSK